MKFIISRDPGLSLFVKSLLEKYASEKIVQKTFVKNTTNNLTMNFKVRSTQATVVALRLRERPLTDRFGIESYHVTRIVFRCCQLKRCEKTVVYPKH